MEPSLSHSISAYFSSREKLIGGIVIVSPENVNMIALPGEAILFQVDESGVAQLCLRAFLGRRNDKMDSHAHTHTPTSPTHVV